MVGREGSREGAPVEGLEHGRLDLEEVVGVQVGADRGDDPGPLAEEAPDGLVGDQVQLAHALAELDVLQAVVLVRRRPERLGEHLEVLHAEGELAPAGAEGEAVDPQQVAEVERREPLKGLLPHEVAARVELDSPGAVLQVQERRSAHVPSGDQAAGDAVGLVALLAVSQAFVTVAHAGDRLDADKRVRELAALGLAQASRLLAPDRDQLGETALARVLPRRRGILARVRLHPRGMLARVLPRRRGMLARVRLHSCGMLAPRVAHGANSRRARIAWRPPNGETGSSRAAAVCRGGAGNPSHISRTSAEAHVDLRDLELPGRAARDLDGDEIVALVSEQGASDR